MKRKRTLTAAELRALGVSPGLVVRHVPPPEKKGPEKGATKGGGT